MRPRITRLPVRQVRAAMAVAATATTALLVATPPAGANPIVYPAALQDAFFGTPADLGERQPGDVLEARAAPTPLGFPDTDTVQIKFRSTDSGGRPISAVTTVLSPRNAAPGRPLVSYQAIINALGLQCAPSTALYASNPLRGIRESPGLLIAIQRGWSVAVPDHLGPNSAYGAAKVGGQITLDGIRAAQRFTPLGLADSPVGMAGYSGGGMATAMAAALAPTYAPELELAGSAYGGVPMDIGEMAKGLGESAHPAFGLAMAAALGLEREYPDRMPISSQLTQPGRELRDRIANACTNEILTSGAGLSIADVADPAVGMELLDNPSVREVLNENSVEKVTSIPNAPVYEWHSPTDVLIPLNSITTTLRRYCDAGLPVQSEEVASPDHLTAAAIGLPGALNFLEARFAGAAPPSNC
ncbi:lipase family protein [Rhodococcus chondri]|uniref:Lipase family protein n=1 Tax=Rhodococcus chondri TaxID=3065941 RepID=A0ABU7JRE6_9NOCA|nr:lipase family protein [Rhodococcus sp. CC-R104]MEE2031887.1 lipase family protein [Rhodococcus sp. CC-R104]